MRKVAARLGPLLLGATLREVWLRLEDRFRPGPRGVPLRAETVPWEAPPARARAASPDDGTVGTLLLDQSVVAGIGNVYKSEVLFLARLDPFTPRADLDYETLIGLYRRARELMLANAERRGRRRTRPEVRRAGPVGGAPGDPRLWVYGRKGRPCFVCGSPIEAPAQGRHARVAC